MGKQCPLCKKEVDDKLIQTCADAEKWVVEQIKRNHPHWLASDGSCPKCMAYYRDLGEKE